MSSWTSEAWSSGPGRGLPSVRLVLTTNTLLAQPLYLPDVPSDEAFRRHSAKTCMQQLQPDDIITRNGEGEKVHFHLLNVWPPACLVVFPGWARSMGRWVVVLTLTDSMQFDREGQGQMVAATP